jgi:hypothetical protein
MRILLIIVTILLLAECSNLIQVFNITEAEMVFLSDSETEEEKKTEKDLKKYDKFHSYFEYAILMEFFAWQKRIHHPEGLCLKGHCPLFDQPPKWRV